MKNNSYTSLSDSQLLDEVARATGVERHATSRLIALLAELDARKLYLGCGYSSLFVYCTQALRLSESAAYARITAARAARTFPTILSRLTSGGITLTTVSLLAAHLTLDNHEALLDAATHKSRREVERLVAGLTEQPDIVSSVRRLPQVPAAAVSDWSHQSHRSQQPSKQRPPNQSHQSASLLSHAASSGSPSQAGVVPPPRPSQRSQVAPLGSERFLLRVTLSARAHENLERARSLLRHQIPTGDPAAIVDRALARLVDDLERTKLAKAAKPRTSADTSSTRYVPAAVRRAVWARDRGQCAFVGTDGRCHEVGFLEFHHLVPFAAGGPTNEANLQLRCRAHNMFEATLFEQSLDACGPSRHNYS
jgi:hypothetical protein